MNPNTPAQAENTLRSEDSAQSVPEIQIPLTPKALAERGFKNVKGRMQHFWSKDPDLKAWWVWFDSDASECPPWVADRFKLTPFMVAAAFGKTRAIERLARTYAEKIDAIGKDGGTALHLAAVDGNSAVVKALLAAGANQTIKNCSQKTAKRIAEECGHWELTDEFDDAPQPEQNLSRFQYEMKRGGNLRNRPFFAKARTFQPLTQKKPPPRPNPTSRDQSSLMEPDSAAEDFGLTMVDAHLPPHMRGKGMEGFAKPPRRHVSFVANLEREAPALRAPRYNPEAGQASTEKARVELMAKVQVSYKKKRAFNLSDKIHES